MAEGLIYHDTKNIWIYIMLGWALATFVKGMKIWLHKNLLSILAEREVLQQHRNWWWSDEPMINYDGYAWVYAVYDVSHLLPQPHLTTFNPTLSHNMYCHLTTNTQQHHYTITIPHHTTPGK